MGEQLSLYVMSLSPLDENTVVFIRIIYESLVWIERTAEERRGNRRGKRGRADRTEHSCSLGSEKRISRIIKRISPKISYHCFV